MSLHRHACATSTRSAWSPCSAARSTAPRSPGSRPRSTTSPPGRASMCRSTWTPPRAASSRRSCIRPRMGLPAPARVQSINASGHKYGLVYPGIGWALWRDAEALPDDLVFRVDYLGGDTPTFALNFSRPGSQVVAQYYTFLRLGHEGYRAVQQGCQDVAMRLSSVIARLGPFELLTDGGELPVFAFFRLREDVTNYIHGLRGLAQLTRARLAGTGLHAARPSGGRRRAAHRGAQRLQRGPRRHPARGSRPSRAGPLAAERAAADPAAAGLPPLSALGTAGNASARAGRRSHDRLRHLRTPLTQSLMASL